MACQCYQGMNNTPRKLCTYTAQLQGPKNLPWIVKISIFADSITRNGKLFHSTIAYILLEKRIANNWYVYVNSA